MWIIYRFGLLIRAEAEVNWKLELTGVPLKASPANNSIRHFTGILVLSSNYALHFTFYGLQKEWNRMKIDVMKSYVESRLPRSKKLTVFHTKCIYKGKPIPAQNSNKTKTALNLWPKLYSNFHFKINIKSERNNIYNIPGKKNCVIRILGYYIIRNKRIRTEK